MLIPLHIDDNFLNMFWYTRIYVKHNKELGFWKFAW